ncbi:hypothetical protein Tco_0555278, partial [Tanacetum coccineum]
MVEIQARNLELNAIAMSATESEYIAASEAVMEAVWIRKFISGLGIVPTINYVAPKRERQRDTGTIRERETAKIKNSRYGNGIDTAIK